MNRTPRGLAIVVGIAVLSLAALVIVLWRYRKPDANDLGALISTVTPSGPNLLVNPGFEQGESPWKWLSWSADWAPFKIGSERFRSGRRAAYLPVKSRGETRQTVIWGVVQEVTIGETFPACMEGWYFVSQWKRGATKQYLQTIVIPLLKSFGPQHQVRMILTGIDHPSYNLANARVFFVDPQKPTTPRLGEWIHFHCPVGEWFQKAWGSLPPAGTRLRVFFEARFDDRGQGSGESVADVWFDDLYLGPC
jgi:hypothetical protein